MEELSENLLHREALDPDPTVNKIDLHAEWIHNFEMTIDREFSAFHASHGKNSLVVMMKEHD